jgi:threonyl-tRNA synthetase
MITITLPDGAQKSFDQAVTGYDVAKSISPKLAEQAACITVDGALWDLHRPLEADCELTILKRTDDRCLELIRHDAAHVLAQALQELYPHIQISIGPVIDNGFYYDVLLPTGNPLSEQDFDGITARMKDIVDRKLPIQREVWSRQDAINLFAKMDEPFKVEIIQDLDPTITEVTLYRQGDFVDLCRGPHLPNTGHIGHAIKLTKLAGAYWRGDSDNVMLQRIYGTAWHTEKDLNAYLDRLEEAEKRDHRRLGKQLNLFHFQEEGPGAVFWHPKGWTVYQEMKNFIRKQIFKAGYAEIFTPQLLDRSLWEQSGHWEKFGDDMFTLEHDKKTFALKPMSCPGGIQVFNQGLKSYRDLPLRLAEFGLVHRNEASGALHGLTRLRAFTQDDAHIFCTPSQLNDEIGALCDFVLNLYKAFGFDDVTVKFSTRPEVRAGSDEIWDKAEAALEAAAKHSGLDYTIEPGDGAFYGPKLDFKLYDAIGREWQCGTIQLDFVLPERLNATYINEQGEKERPIMIHRAIFGSLERFMGVLTEHYGGAYPLWLAPTQVVVASVIDGVADYAQHVVHLLKDSGLRTEGDLRNEKISYKIREHSHQKIPVIAVVGQKEKDNNTITLRQLGSTNQTTLTLNEALSMLENKAKAPEF